MTELTPTGRLIVSRTIGILGGMSPESTITYYKHIVHRHIEQHGDHAYPEIVIFSVSFEPYIRWPEAGRWDLVGDGLAAAAQRLAAAGADLIVIATNTMHMVHDRIQAAVDVPVLSILDVVGETIEQRGLRTVGLLGTRYTMESPLYPNALATRGISVIAPEAADRQLVNRIIYEELVQGNIRAESRCAYLEVIARLRQRGAQGVILGCTEIPLLVTEADAGLPLFDTTILHADAAFELASG
jgi:aspartate racemase